MFPPSILYKDRPSENERSKRLKLMAVPVCKLPRTVMPLKRVQIDVGSGAGNKKAVTFRRVSTFRQDETKSTANKGVEKNAVANANDNNIKDKKAKVYQQRQVGTPTKTTAKGTNANNSPSNSNTTSKDKQQRAPAKVNNPIPKSPSLLGATIRIRKGKFANHTGKIIERQHIRRLMIDTVPTAAFDFREVQIVKTSALDREAVDDREASILAAAKCAQSTAARLHRQLGGGGLAGAQSAFGREGEDDHALQLRYEGATVRVLQKTAHYGKMGRVVRIIMGDWYITDNPNIANAFQPHKFDVLRYAGDVAADKQKSEVVDLVDSADENEGGEKKIDDKVQEATSVKDASKRNDKEQVKNNATLKKIDNPNNPVTAKEGPITTSTTNSKEKPQPDSIIGATIRVKKGRYKGLTGIILEKQSIKRLQLDTIPTPLRFEEVRVLQYSKEADLSDPYQKYMHAQVRVVDQQPNQADAGVEQMNAGVEGKVTRVIILGDWYITDNPNITTAFPIHKFDVIKGAPGRAATAIDVDVEDKKTEKECIEILDDDAKKIECNDEKKNEVGDIALDGGTEEKGKAENAPEPPSIVDDPKKNVEAAEQHLPPKDVSKEDFFCKEVSKGGDETGAEAEQQPSPEPPSINDDPNTHVSKEDAVSKEVSKNGDSKDGDAKQHASSMTETEVVEVEQRPPPEPPSTIDHDPNVAKEDTSKEVSNQVSTEDGDTQQHDTAMTTGNAVSTKEVCTSAQLLPPMENIESASTTDNVVSNTKEEVCSSPVVQLPPMENIELAARLSAFDSFLFLADGYTKGNNNNNEDANLKARNAVINQGEVGLMTRIQHGDNDTGATADIPEGATKSASSTANTVKPTEIGKQETTQQPITTDKYCNHETNDNRALSKLVLQLIQRKQKSQQWPAVKVLPGMEVLVEGQKQQSLRMVPMEERIIFHHRSVVPGSWEERKEVGERLAAFDDYLFLID